MHRLHGEAGSADMSMIEIDKENLRKTLDKYNLCDIFNFDETAIFYSAPPRTTISHEGFSGWKENKKRLTVGLMCNADVTEKWKDPVIIGHAKRPDCFMINKTRKEAHHHGFFTYEHNENAWMTKTIFHKFLIRFNRAMKYQRRYVLLVLDNFSGHMVDYTPSNVELLFLPPNTTSRLQPLDGGIIRAFKAHFKRNQYSKAYQYIGMIQLGRQDKLGPVEKIFEIDQLQAMKWIRESWKAVTKETIHNCWNATIFRAIEDTGVDEGKNFLFLCLKNSRLT